MTRFSDLFAAHLSRADMTMRGFAQAVGSSPATLSRLRTGRRAPTGIDWPSWAQALGLSAKEAEEFQEAADDACGVAAMGSNDIGDPLDGWWLAYHHSFAADGTIARTLAHFRSGAVRWLTKREGSVQYLYRGRVERLGDVLVIGMQEEHGGQERVQATMRESYDQRRPVLLHGLVSGIAPRKFRRPVSIPTAALMLMIYAGSESELKGQMDDLESTLGIYDERRLGPFWPGVLGGDRSLRRCLDLRPGEDLDHLCRSLIDNTAGCATGVLAANPAG